MPESAAPAELQLTVHQTPWGLAFDVPIVGTPPDISPGLVITFEGTPSSGAPTIDALVEQVPEPPPQPEGRRQRRIETRQRVVRALSGAAFFIEVYKSSEFESIKKLQQEGVEPPGGAAFEHFDPALVFYAESAVLHMRAALDAMAPTFGEIGVGGVTYGPLAKGLVARRDDLARPFHPLLQEARPITEELKAIRDLIVHPGKRGQFAPTSFGSLVRLPHIPGRPKALVALPAYAGDRLVRDVLSNLFEGVRSHIVLMLVQLWTGSAGGASPGPSEHPRGRPRERG